MDYNAEALSLNTQRMRVWEEAKRLLDDTEGKGQAMSGEQRAQWAAVTETLDRVWRQSPVRPATGAAL